MTQPLYLSVTEREALYEDALDRLYARYGTQDLSPESRELVDAAMEEVWKRRRLRDQVRGMRA